MSLYSKIQTVKNELLEANTKKSGQNKFAGFSYYELADFLPTIVKLCLKNKLLTKVSFTNDLATLEIINVEEPFDREVYTSPMREIQMKGTNEIQSLGGVETYQRRYLYMAAFDIVESDMFDGKDGNSFKVKNEVKAPTDFMDGQPINESQKQNIRMAIKDGLTTEDGIKEQFKKEIDNLTWQEAYKIEKVIDSRRKEIKK